MRFREFSKTGFKLSIVGMGTYYDPLWIALAMLFKVQVGHENKLRALNAGLDAGMNFIDTAEIYQSETIVADAVHQRKRDEIFIATKVWSNHLRPDAVVKSCKRSLSKLGTSYIDLYQIHFPSSRVPIKETMGAMEKLIDEGLIRSIGVSNFSFRQIIEARDVLKKNELASVQLEYNLLQRNIEKDILPYCERERISIIAYFPLAHGKLARGSVPLFQVAKNHSSPNSEIKSSEASLAWLIAKSPIVFPIPRASNVTHVLQDARACDLELSNEEIELLEKSHSA